MYFIEVFSPALVAAYFEYIVFGPDWWNFMAFVSFVVYITSVLSGTITSFKEESHKSTYDLLSKTETDLQVIFTHQTALAELYDETLSLVSETANSNLSVSYNYNNSYYFSYEYINSVCSAFTAEISHLNSLLNLSYNFVSDKKLLSLKKSVKR